MLAINHLNLSFDKKNTLATIENFKIEKNQQVALLGRSGGGKTTLLLKILQHRQNYENIKLTNCNLGYLSQSPMILPWYSPQKNVMFGSILRGESINEIHYERANKILESVGLSDSIKKRVEVFSGGEKQRLALARCLFEKSDLILLDEPLASLDRLTRLEITSLCKNILKNTAILLVTHDPRDVIEWVETAYVLTRKQMLGPYALSEFKEEMDLINILSIL